MKNTSIRLEETTIDSIIVLAEKEKRNFNQMTRILLDEAIDNRNFDLEKEFIKQIDS